MINNLQLELLPPPPLFDKIISNKSPNECFSEIRSVRIITSLLEAVAYLHKNDIVHRDIKLENIFFVSEQKDTIKLVDFGLSRHHKKDEAPMTNIVGTDYYMAPEVIKGKYDRSCDIWSIGIVAYILLCGYPPFNGDTNRGVFESITKGKLVFPAQAWSNKSGLVKDFITCLLRKDPRSRFTVQEALMHPWIASRTTQCDQESDTKYDDSIVPKMLKPIQNLKTRNPSRIIDKRPSDVPEACPTRIAEIMKEFQKRLTFDKIDESGMHLDSEETIHYLTRKSSSKQDLIDQVFPKHVSKALLEGRRLEPDRAEMATVIFTDIVGYTKISSILSPEQVSDLLDRLYLKFDKLSVKHDVFKIETIGDAFVGICNLVKDQSTDHAKRIVEFAIDCVKAAAKTPILCDFPSIGSVRIRVGIHCGPVVARVVGSRNPRYCVFGDTVNITARMESHSLPMKIQCSDQATQVLKAQVPGITLIPRGLVSMKGKGKMETFFVSPNCDQFVSKGDGIIVTRNLKPIRNLKTKNPSAA